MAPYIATVKYYEPELDSDLHQQNFLTYANSYTAVMREVADYVGDSDIESITITCVAEDGSLISIPDDVAENIIATEGWYSNVVK